MLYLKDEKGEEAWSVNMPVYIIIYLYINLTVVKTLSMAIKLLAIFVLYYTYAMVGQRYPTTEQEKVVRTYPKASHSCA